MPNTTTFPIAESICHVVRSAVLTICLATILFPAFPAVAASAPLTADSDAEVGITPQLGKTIPLAATFVDEKGDAVQLGAVLDRPALLVLVYFECPNICGPVLNNVRELVDTMDLKPGADYKIVTVSFDDREDAALASAKKANYLNALKKPIPADAWRFLTGDERNIRLLTDSVGFHFKKENGGITHPSALIALAPDGKITRYIPGVSYAYGDVELALREAAAGQVGAIRPTGGPTMAPSGGGGVFQTVCSFLDPRKSAQVLWITRLAGAAILILAVGFVAFFVFRSSKRKGDASVPEGANRAG